ncbi:DsbA family protein [Vibrio sp. SCSIO 43135]|uniref:DsbA family protein n=1 Tax=Vibrio sp. SCSIO 43135 TaxID=2819096 RepID=UPI0020758CA3|nr:DsbA family protein [Vibrio sp. SCSIO 43135]USD42734.1 DsbA family protein [Vibrio sp. SCSIO 43135]
MTANKLYYVYDPMCSWCWGYKPTWSKIEQAISKDLDVVYVVGGLAPDSDVPMPLEMQTQIASYWKRIEDYLGTQFNYDFWEKNTPRRSTYPSCRATLAARKQGKEQTMLTAIQHAYYLQARNPSDNSVLIEVAKEAGLDQAQFKADLESSEIETELQNELALARSIGGNSFPSLFVEREGRITELRIDYQNADSTIDEVKALLALI